MNDSVLLKTRNACREAMRGEVRYVMPASSGLISVGRVSTRVSPTSLSVDDALDSDDRDTDARKHPRAVGRRV
jgi:hypothetical protein